MRLIIGFINLIFDIYLYVIIASILFSWLYAAKILDHENQFVQSAKTVLQNLTEPLLGFIRRYIPKYSGLDISPFVLLVIIFGGVYFTSFPGENNSVKSTQLNESSVSSRSVSSTANTTNTQVNNRSKSRPDNSAEIVNAQKRIIRLQSNIFETEDRYNKCIYQRTRQNLSLQACNWLLRRIKDDRQTILRLQRNIIRLQEQ